jgi:uncharacterized OB-fold protein
VSEAYAKLLPAPDRDSQPFWDGVRAGELRVQRCDGCGAYRWPARAVCNRCHSFEATWTPLSGRGRIVSWITTHQVFMKAYADDTPYAVVLVTLDEQDDLQLVGNLMGGREPADGMPVRAVFAPVTDEATLLQWEPAEA